MKATIYELDASQGILASLVGGEKDDGSKLEPIKLPSRLSMRLGFIVQGMIPHLKLFNEERQKLGTRQNALNKKVAEAQKAFEEEAKGDESLVFDSSPFDVEQNAIQEEFNQLINTTVQLAGCSRIKLEDFEAAGVSFTVPEIMSLRWLIKAPTDLFEKDGEE